MSEKSPIVTFSEINKAFNKNHEAVMSRAHKEAEKRTDDPVEAASRMAALGNALKVLEAADAQAQSKVLVSPDDRVASLLQTFLAAKAANKAQLQAMPSGLHRARFDDKDILGWIGSFFTFWKRIVPAEWREAPAAPEPLPDNPQTFRVGLLGDWGTGRYGAPESAKSIEEVRNVTKDGRGYKLIMHLGDVYYSGDDDEVRDHFLKFWPKNAGATSRACNSNHEMYTGGHAYFKQTLKKFKQAASHFALQNDHWIFVGLDTAYEDKDLAKNQVAWLTNIVAGAGGRRVILFSHHQPFSWLEEQHPKMTGKLGELLKNKKIFGWYWGHEHRCVLYDKHEEWGLIGRCVGHGGYPYFRKDWETLGAKKMKGNSNWRVLTKRNFAPGGIVLDGFNPFIDKDDRPDRYGPQGYMTLEFDGPRLNEIVHAPDGMHFLERRLV